MYSIREYSEIGEGGSVDPLHLASNPLRIEGFGHQCSAMFHIIITRNNPGKISLGQFPLIVWVGGWIGLSLRVASRTLGTWATGSAATGA